MVEQPVHDVSWVVFVLGGILGKLMVVESVVESAVEPAVTVMSEVRSVLFVMEFVRFLLVLLQKFNQKIFFSDNTTFSELGGVFNFFLFWHDEIINQFQKFRIESW